MADGINGNYVSDAAILAWVQTEQSRQYGQLGATMDFETARGEMATDAANIKQHLLKATKDSSALPALQDEIAAFQEKYGATPEFEGVTAKIAEVAETVAAKANEVSVAKEGQDVYDAQPVPAADEDDLRGTRPATPGALDKDDIKNWADALDTVLDDSNHNQQIGMIHINELKSTIDHTAELASQLIKSSNDTTKFTINNFS